MLKKSSLFPHICKENLIDNYVDHKPLFQNCKFYVTKGRDTESRAGPQWSYSLNVYTVLNSSAFTVDCTE